MANKKKSIKETLLNSVGQKFKANWNWYVILGVSQNGQKAFVRSGNAKEQIDAKAAFDYLQATPAKDRL